MAPCYKLANKLIIFPVQCMCSLNNGQWNQLINNCVLFFQLLSCVWLFATKWTVVCQAPLSMGFSRQEYWSGFPFPSPGDVPNPGIKSRSPALQTDPLPSESPGKPLIEADPLTTTQELAEELNTGLSTFYTWHLKQIGKVKKLDTWVPHELTTNQKTCHFEASSSLILHNNEPFLDWIVTCDEKWILYDNWWWPAQWWDWEEAAKHFPRPNLLPVWSTTAFWIPVKPLHLGSMLNKSLRCTKAHKIHG